MTVTDAFDADFDVMGQFGGVAGDLRDPHPELTKLRAAGPVHHVRTIGFTGEEVDQYTVLTYDAVVALLRDNETFTSGSIREIMAPVMGRFALIAIDEPEHRRHRSLVAQAFRQSSLQRWEDSVVRGIMHALIDRFADRGSAELVREYTYRFPVQVIAALLGLPPDDPEQFHERALAIINVAARPERGLAAAAELVEYLQTIVDARRAEPADDVISDLVQAELDGEQLTDEEIFSFLRLLLPAGAETTYRATGNLLFGLLTNPGQLDAVRHDRSLLPAAVEEAVRWEPPLLITSRQCARDTEFYGHRIPAGATVIAHTGSANRDESRWPDGERFDIHRAPLPMASFGMGPHMCLGMHLARMEMRVAVEALFDRLPELRFAPEDDPTGDPHIRGERFRSPTMLPVRWG